MLQKRIRNKGYLFEKLNHRENEMKKGETLQGCSHLKANRWKVSQEK